MGYKILGFAVWKGAKWYLRRRFGVLVSRPALTAAGVGLGIGAVAVINARRQPA